MSHRKRKKYPRDLQCVLFPDDVIDGAPRMKREPSSLSSGSSAKSWEKCGGSFLESPVVKNLKSSGRTLSAIRKLSPALVQTSGLQCNEDPVQITWSSSDGEQSDTETQKQHLTRVSALQQRPHRPSAPIRSYTREPCLLSSDKDDLPVIDSDSNLDESDKDAKEDSGQQISDCESESSDGQKKLIPKSTNVAELEISGYVSDGENIGDSVTPSRLDSESFPLQTVEGSRRSVSDWVRSAQAMLQTPQKLLVRQSKTPEDSAKKKRKFQRGGLAERLNQLQCRQRSAVSLWRHQSISDTSSTTAATVDRPGVLMLEVLEVRKECSMQLALCEPHQPHGEGHQHSNSVPEDRARVLVLFNRETAAQLIPASRDIIHIYPPWQRLSMEGFTYDIILNTHFSQKVFRDSKPATMPVSRSLLTADKCMPYYLGKMFGLVEVCRNTEVAVPSTLSRFGGWRDLTGRCLSLLEAIEGLGQAGSVGQDIEVVVQRVFSNPVPDCSAVSIVKPRVPSRSSTAPPPAERGQTRLCVLVQDSCGMFSVVQLHLLPCKDDVLHYCQKWQGKTCVLRGIKVVQRVTREKRTRLFSLIDSLWPPVLPLRDHGNTPSTSTEIRAAGPAPSFCYLLSGQESSVEPTEGQSVSTLYVAPARQTLRDIVQSEVKPGRCNFVATVIYKKVQSCDVGQGEVWLVLTDPSLQEEQPDRPCRRTVTLCVSTSCVLTSSILEALHSPAACCVSFRDAIKEHGVLLCAEHSVIEVCSEGSLQSTTRPEILSQLLTEPRAKTLPQPVRLDPLSLETTPNSLCTLSGVIVGVDEDTAYSWPACNVCGSDNLEMSAEGHQNFYCVTCKLVVDKPDTKVQLEVFLSSSLSNCTLKVKLQKKTIMSILNAAALEGNEFPGYNVENVLGKEVGPLAVYVRVITKKPAPWIGLEEICL
ncbi:DNA repair-scaffolding protein [Solea solea]|uniref:DNA repair-scaffolding protein n=1 Tax=Solea solea TaxID=90069 RepID=UPI00272C08E6|nr:DNA repair-scaffolding protein [Solea solea]